MGKVIRRAAVIGSGVMGASIAAHLTNVGIEVLMLDVLPKSLTEKEKQQGRSLDDRLVRNRISEMNKQALLKQKPSPLTSKKNLSLLKTGNLADNLAQLADVDWIIEVVVENLQIKKQVLQQIDANRRPGTIVSTNTSGISVEAMIADCSDDMKAHFLGTHFFNPPRYLKLLEIIPTQYTKQTVITSMKAFCESALGKGVVITKDTPNFIGNRIGTYGLQIIVKEMLAENLTIGEVDSITGPMIGRPKSATFRTLDVVGIDVFLDVVNNVYEQTSGKEKAAFTPDPLLEKLAEYDWLGAKTGQGFYKKIKKDGASEILQLNYETMTYEKRNRLMTPMVEQANQAKGTKAKLQTLLSATDDKASRFIWNILKQTLLYAGEVAYEIAYEIKDIDDAMKWGFGWRYGPFEIWDMLGVKETVARMEKDGLPIPNWIQTMLANDITSFYRDEATYYDGKSSYKSMSVNEKVIHIPTLLKGEQVIKKNSGASLIDIGDDVALLTFTSPHNAIGLDVMMMMKDALAEVEKNYAGLVIGNTGNNFCVGANLAMMLMEAQDDNYFELDHVIRQFQQMTMNIKYATRPVVVAPFQMTLGGGAEVALPAASVQAAMETYMGLVEVGVGLIPGGGGTKELYLKMLRNMPDKVTVDLQQIANSVFEKVAMAKVSRSAAEAKELGYLDGLDHVTANPDFLIHDAKQQVLTLTKQGYMPPAREKIPVVGNAGYATMLLGAKDLHLSGYASDHDLKIAEKLAYVLSGGRVRQGTEMDEQLMLDLEREAFLSLIGEPKTQMRMQHMLLKGKPLRN